MAEQSPSPLPLVARSFAAAGSLLAQALNALRHRAKVGIVAHIMAIRMVALAGNVGSGLLTAAFLGPDGRGEQAALLLGTTVIGAICTLGLHASLIYNVRADPDRGSRYFGSSMIIAAGCAILGIGFGLVLIPHWLTRYSASTILLAQILLVSLPLTNVAPLFGGILEAFGHFGVANRALYFQSLGTLAMLIVTAVAGWLTPLSAAICYVFPAFPAFIYLFWQARKIVRPRFTMGSLYPRRLLRFGLQFYGVDILGMLSGYLDQLVIVYLLEPAAVGAYAVALSLSRVLTVAQGAVSTVLFPSIAARDAGSVIDMVSRATRVTSVVNAAGAAILGLVGPSLLLLLYGTRFAAAVMPFVILLGEAVISSAARTLAQTFSGTGRPAAVTAMEVVGVAASLTAMLVLVPIYGIDGAACSTLIGGFARLASVLVGFRLVMGVGMPPLIINRADVAWVTGR